MGIMDFGHFSAHLTKKKCKTIGKKKVQPIAKFPSFCSHKQSVWVFLTTTVKITANYECELSISQSSVYIERHNVSVANISLKCTSAIFIFFVNKSL